MLQLLAPVEMYTSVVDVNLPWIKHCEVISDFPVFTMPPKTKSDTVKFLLGQPDSALRQDFTQAIQQGEGDSDILPWSGSLQLPTLEQVLKLYFYLREAAGKKNSFVTRGENYSPKRSPFGRP